MKHALKFNFPTDESQLDHAQRQSRQTVAIKHNTRFKKTDPACKVHPGPDRVEVFSIKINKRMEERVKERVLEEITIPSHSSNNINILPNAVPSW